MTAPTVFISYSSKNKDWVKNWLLPKIEGQGIQTRVDFRDFEIGTPSMINMERAVDECAKTILVFTPEWLGSEWTQFESLMLMLQDPIGARKKILPLMLDDCKLPSHLGIFTYADFREKDEWDFQFERMISQIKKDFAALAPPPKKYPPLDEKYIDIQRLPQTPFELFGRQTELNVLDQAWETAKTNVISFVAYGGVGKTTLVNKWVEKMRWDNFRGAKRVFAWSFYSQGTSEQVTSADLFIAEALKWFGDPSPDEGSAWDKGQRLADLVRSEKTLLLLDGMEPLQSSHDFERGKIHDPALATLVKELARENSGLCVISTRDCVADLDPYAAITRQIDLEQISAEAGRALLRMGGVQGTDAELESAALDFGTHALALNLLASFLHEIPEHHVSNAKQIPDIDVPLKQDSDKHPRRVIAAFAKRFGNSSEVDVLRLLGLFNSPAGKEPIAALRAAPPIPGLTEHIANITDADWYQLLSRLRNLKLLAPESKHRPEAVDCHPLLREHFGEQLQAANPAAWREANQRLYEYYKSTAKEYPDTMEEMAPLFAAVMHGCQAGKYQEAFVEVYWKRIAREKEFFTTKKLGAFGSDLAALSGFFEGGSWRKPVDGLTEADKGFVLNQAGFRLRALGRLAEAAGPMQVGLEARIVEKNWKNAAISASNLSELTLTSGDVKQALDYAEQSVGLADQSGDEFWRVFTRTSFAEALHQTGRLTESPAAFQEAEEMQKKNEPSFPLLYSLRGYQYCDLLSSQGRSAEVERQARQTLEWDEKYAMAQGSTTGLLEFALDNLSLGRALTPSPALPRQGQGRVQGGGEGDFLTYLNRAVDGFRQAGTQDKLPLGLLARAEYYRITDDLNKAKRDLDEAFAISTRGGMELFVADCHLAYARLQVEGYRLKVERFDDAQHEPATLNLQPSTSLLAEARQHVSTAKQMIDRMGYHRRDGEVAALEEELADL